MDEQTAAAERAGKSEGRSVSGKKALFQARIRPEHRTEGIELLSLIERRDKERSEGLYEWLPDLLALLPGEAASEGLRQAIRIARRSSSSAYNFLSRLVYYWETLHRNDLVRWVDQGVRLLERNPSAGRAYFDLQSRTSRQALYLGEQSVRFHEVQESLRLYIHAICGRPMEVHSIEQEGEHPFLSSPSIFPFTDGQGIYLPSCLKTFPTYQENRLYYRMLAAHQAAHFEFGTFAFSLASFLKRLKQHPCLRNWKPILNETDLAGEFFSNLQVFHRLFPLPGLSERIFQLVEGGRIRAHLQFQYPGLMRDGAPLIAHMISGRPKLEDLSMGKGFFELLLHLTLSPDRVEAAVPSRFDLLRRFLRHCLRDTLRPGASVEDSARVTLEIYLALMPAQKQGDALVNPDTLFPGHPRIEDLFDATGMEEFLHDVEPLRNPCSQPNPNGSPRGSMNAEDLDPSEIGTELQGSTDLGNVQKCIEMAELIEDASEGHRTAAYRMLSLDKLKELLERGDALEMLETFGHDDDTPDLFFKEPVKQLHFRPLIKKNQEDGTLSGAHMMSRLRREQRIHFRNPNAEIFFYDEWDHTIQDYRNDWCRLLETEVKLINGSEFTARVTEAYGPLISSVRRQFEKLRPEQVRLERPLQDGEEVDLERTVEFIVDRRCGLSGSNRLYQQRRKVERDVCTLFLLDMSASTGEPVPSHSSPSEEGDLPPIMETGETGGPLPESVGEISHLLSYLSLGAGPQNRVRSAIHDPHKRIIDVEKEALVVMAEALEALGDRYGIFGFSGCGRSQVEFYTIKAFRQNYGDKVRDRIGAVEPRGSTRMGAALRHCRIKLRIEEARRKNLFLLSDGFPQDQDYGYDRSGHEYGIQDTARAMEELAEEGINIYCITVDRCGEDYLRRLCPESSYMVIRDIPALPEMLLKLYRKVTFQAHETL